MRMRACEAVRSRLAGMRGGHAAQVDGTYPGESLSGDRSRPGAGPMPRPPRHHGGGVRLRGLSGEKVCVVCEANDLGDCFCEVASGGCRSSRGLADALRGHVGPGAAVAADLHGGCPGALAELGPVPRGPPRGGRCERRARPGERPAREAPGVPRPLRRGLDEEAPALPRLVLPRRAVRQDRRWPGGGAGRRPGKRAIRELLAGPRPDAPALRGVLGDVNSALTENHPINHSRRYLYLLQE